MNTRITLCSLVSEPVDEDCVDTTGPADLVMAAPCTVENDACSRLTGDAVLASAQELPGPGETTDDECGCDC